MSAAAPDFRPELAGFPRCPTCQQESVKVTFQESVELLGAVPNVRALIGPCGHATMIGMGDDDAGLRKGLAEVTLPGFRIAHPTAEQVEGLVKLQSCEQCVPQSEAVDAQP